MPKTGNGFPLSRAKTFKLGAGWAWRIVELKAGVAECKLLVAYHPNKENYLAILGYGVGTDTHVMGVLEYHGSHPGWHVHGSCLAATPAQFGRVHYPDMVRFPDGKQRHRDIDFGVTESNALEPAIKHFRLGNAFDELSPLLAGLK